MKIKKHTITHAIKYIFLSLLLALPFIAMLPSTFYYAFNQNAQDNTANEVITVNTNEVNTREDIILNNYYSLNGNIQLTIYSNIENSLITYELYSYAESNTIFYEELNIINGTKQTMNIYCEKGIYDIYLSTTEGAVEISPNEIELEIEGYSNKTLLNALGWTWEYIAFDNNTTFQMNEYTKLIFEGDEHYYQYLRPAVYLPEIGIKEHDLNNQNAFYYASSQVFEKPLFNWVKNSIFVVPIMGMLGIFGISEMNFISSLLIYWVNILSIYAILNIILLVIEKLGSFGKRKNE